MLKKLFTFLVRKRLGLKKYQRFMFIEQKDISTYYFFDDDKVVKGYADGNTKPSSVSLNWLLNDECKIVKL